MPKIHYGKSLWLSRLPKVRRPNSPRLHGHVEAEVVIIGGGSVGCAAAYVFAASGLSVVLVEAAALGQGATACSAGVLTQEPGVDYQILEARHGRRVARRVWQMNRRAVLDAAAVVRRLKIHCQLETQDSIYFMASDDEEGMLRSELTARRVAGLNATWLSKERVHCATNLERAGGIRTRGNSQVDPYRLCLGLAAAASKRGAKFYERSPVTSVLFDRKGVDIRTKSGTLRARRVIMTTGVETDLFKPLARHLIELHTYMVATPPLSRQIRDQLGRRDAILWDTEKPSHYLRWTRDGRIVFGGADRLVPHPRHQTKVLVQRTGQLMYELSTLYPVISGIQPEYAWESPVSTTIDRLPYVGPHRNFPHHLFAVGFGNRGLSTGFLASRVLLRHHLGTSAKGDELLGFGR